MIMDLKVKNRAAQSMVSSNSTERSGGFFPVFSGFSSVLSLVSLPVSPPVLFRKKCSAAAVAAALLLCLDGQTASAMDMAQAINEAVRKSPLVMESTAKEEEAELLIKRSEARKYPTLGVQAAGNVGSVSGSASRRTTAALVGRVTLYDFKANKAEIERDRNRREFFRYKTDEAREQTAYEVAQSYLQALRFRELILAEQANLERHRKIASDLAIIVGIDRGRKYELTQAQARVLAVENRVVQHEKALRLSLTRLRKYGVVLDAGDLRNPFALTSPDTQEALKTLEEHPSVKAQVFESRAVLDEVKARKRSEKPRIVLESSLDDRLKNNTRVLLEWNFLDRSNRFYTESFTRQYAAAQARTDVIRDDIESRSLAARMDYEESSRLLKAAQAQIKTSQEVVELYNKQFKIARRTLIELLNAYSELSAVETAKVGAQSDRRAAVMEWMYANASLLRWAKSDRSGVPANEVAELEKTLADGLSLKLSTLLGLLAQYDAGGSVETGSEVGSEPLPLRAESQLHL